MDETLFNHNRELQSFTLTKNGIISFINYQVRNNVYVLWHSEVPSQFRGQGIGKELVEKTFEYIIENDLKAMATCSYIRAIARQNNKWHKHIQF
jgi:predicted GNAT family acetyltransferase